MAVTVAVSDSLLLSLSAGTVKGALAFTTGADALVKEAAGLLLGFTGVISTSFELSGSPRLTADRCGRLNPLRT